MSCWCCRSTLVSYTRGGWVVGLSPFTVMTVKYLGKTPLFYQIRVQLRFGANLVWTKTDRGYLRNCGKGMFSQVSASLFSSYVRRKWAVRILLECFLVFSTFSQFSFSWSQKNSELCPANWVFPKWLFLNSMNCAKVQNWKGYQRYPMSEIFTTMSGEASIQCGSWQ